MATVGRAQAAGLRSGRALAAVVLVLTLIAVVVSARRLVGLADGGAPAPTRSAIDAAFAQPALLTLAHVAPGLLFLALAPLQFVRRLRTRHARVHRWLGRALVALGIGAGVTALAMGAGPLIGGASQAAASFFYGVVFVVTLAKGLWHARRREFAAHREWMIRAYAVGLAIATIRPIVALFFVFSGLPPREFFGIAFWIGFTAHLIAGEVWIAGTRGRVSPAGPPRGGTGGSAPAPPVLF